VSALNRPDTYGARERLALLQAEALRRGVSARSRLPFIPAVVLLDLAIWGYVLAVVFPSLFSR
jgi:hypothetical protein